MEETEETLPIPPGKCELCGGTFSKDAMGEHLASCRDTNAPKASGKAKPRRENVFHLLVEGADLPEYWMHLEAPASASLLDLDYLLREVWLECCGHLSLFEIAGQAYSAESMEGLIVPMEEFEDESMDTRLGDVLQPGMVFIHQYDMGTMTELALEVLSVQEREIRGKAIEILARNEPPERLCESCGKPATQVCCVCIWEGEGWVCDACLPKHKCKDEGFLPVMNSPRTGMCAYGATWE